MTTHLFTAEKGTPAFTGYMEAMVEDAVISWEVKDAFGNLSIKRGKVFGVAWVGKIGKTNTAQFKVREVK